MNSMAQAGVLLAGVLVAEVLLAVVLLAGVLLSWVLLASVLQEVKGHVILFQLLIVETSGELLDPRYRINLGQSDEETYFELYAANSHT